MKLRKILLSILPVALVPTGLLTTVTACNNNKLPSIVSHDVRKAFINTLSQASSGRYYYVTSSYGQVEVHHFNESEIGYINVDEYVLFNMQYKDRWGDECENFSSVTKDYKTVITNNCKDNGATCTIDYKNQTITFSDYDKFATVENEFATNPLAHGAGGGEKYLVPDKKTGLNFQNSTFISGGTYTIDLSKYNIKAYYDGGKGYLPFDLFKNIIDKYPRLSVFYNGVNFYQICTANSIYAVDLYKEIKAESTILTQEYMDYTYNLLALTLDHKFGLDKRVCRDPENKGKVKTYFPNGAYEALAPYKEALTSLDPDVSNNAMFEVFADLTDDGGHAGYRGTNLLSSRPHENVRGPETTQTFAVDEYISDARTSIYTKTGEPVGPADYWVKKYSKTFTKTTAPDNYMQLYQQASEEHPILYITFDGFNSVDTYLTEEEKTKGQALYTNVTLSTDDNPGNYYLDTIRMTMGADQFIRTYNQGKTTEKQINDVVIDLSYNGGGTVYTEYFLASWICGTVKQKLWNPHTKAYAEFEVQADLDGNGEFTDADHLPESTNVYLITSETSFSCGNALPCNVVDNRPNNTKYIGSTSGGGACFVDSNMQVGLGNVFRSSSNFHSLRGNSTKENPISNDSGHLSNVADFWLYYASTAEDAEKFVDRATINQEIWKL